jgi:hypothetical protein
MRLKDWVKTALQYSAIVVGASLLYGVLMEPTDLKMMMNMTGTYMMMFGAAMTMLFGITVYKVMLPVSLGFGSTRKEAFVGMQCFRLIYCAIVTAVALLVFLLNGEIGMAEFKPLAPICIGLMPLFGALGAVLGIIGNRFGKSTMAVVSAVGALLVMGILFGTLMLFAFLEDKIGVLGMWMFPVLGLVIYGLTCIWEHKKVMKYCVKL